LPVDSRADISDEAQDVKVAGLAEEWQMQKSIGLEKACSFRPSMIKGSTPAITLPFPFPRNGIIIRRLAPE